MIHRICIAKHVNINLCFKNKFFFQQKKTLNMLIKVILLCLNLFNLFNKRTLSESQYIQSSKSVNLNF